MRIVHYRRELRRQSTPAEIYFWKKVRGRQLFGFKFRRQQYIQFFQSENLQKYFIVDFYVPSKKLIIEIDGGIHKNQVKYDKKRESILLSMGYRIIRFPNQEVLEYWGSVEFELFHELHGQ